MLIMLLFIVHVCEMTTFSKNNVCDIISLYIFLGLPLTKNIYNSGDDFFCPLKTASPK